MKARLSVLLILVSTAISYLMYGFMHDSLHATLSREENDFIFDRLHTIRSIINDNQDYLEIVKKDIDWEGQHVPLPYYYLRFLDENGHQLICTPGMDKELPSKYFPPPLGTLSSPHQDQIYMAENGRFYLLVADSVAPPGGAIKRVTVQIGLDITSEITIDEHNHAKLTASVIVRSLVFALIIVLIINKVLKPLDEMVRAAEQVSAKMISDRVNPEGWPVELKRLAISFNEMLDRLQDGFSRMSQFASNMAHEIRTPINNIMGEAEIALAWERSPDEYRKVLVSGIEECQHLSNLVSSLLFLAHAENAGEAIHRVSFNPREEIESILDFYQPRIEEKMAVVELSGYGEIAGDPLLFRQAVANLLKNVLNYSDDGVKVDICVAPLGEKRTEVVVTDTGYGMEEKELERIFDRFYRVNRSKSDNIEGSGLGLAIVKAIMDLHGGTVSVTSRPGAGSTFTLVFPASATSPR